MRARSARVAVVVVVLTLSCAPLSTGCDRRPASPPDEAAAVLRRAVDRTIASGSLRFRGRVIPTGGTTVEMSGITSLTAPTAHVTTDVDTDPLTPPAEVRVVNGEAWVLAPGAPRWMTVDPSAAGEAGAGASPSTSWKGLLDQIRGATAVVWAGDDRVSGRLLGGTVEADIDSRGRVHGLRLGLPRGALEIELFDFGVTVDVAPPP